MNNKEKVIKEAVAKISRQLDDQFMDAIYGGKRPTPTVADEARKGTIIEGVGYKRKNHEPRKD